MDRWVDVRRDEETGDGWMDGKAVQILWIGGQGRT